MFGDHMYRLAESNKFERLVNFINFLGEPDLEGRTNETALYRISRRLASDSARHSEMVKLLINKGADLLWQHKHTGLSPAVHIIQCNDDDLANFLISKLRYINISLDSDKNTSLHHAVQCGNEKTVLKLLKKGADPNLRNKFNYSSIHEAVLSKNGHKMIKMLVEYGGDINLKPVGGRAPLELVEFTEGSKETMYRVLQCKPLLDVRDAYGMTPLSTFVNLLDERFDEIAMLVDSGCNVNVKIEGGLNLLHEMALEDFTVNIQNIARLLIDYGINLDDKTIFEENTPLHLAVLLDNVLLAKHLIVSHANLFLKNVNGETPLDTAILKFRTNMVSVIISHAILNDIPEEKLVNKSGKSKIARNTYMSFIVETTIKSCEKELSLLKNTRLQFFPTLTLYDVSLMSEKELAELMKTSEIARSLDFSTIKIDDFFHYEYLLKERLHAARRCRVAKDFVLHHLLSFPSQRIPQSCLERIIYYMDEKYLLRLQRQILNSLEFDGDDWD